MTTRRVLINTLTGGGSRIVGLVIGFVTTPLLVHDLGDGGFGLFVLVGAIVGYVGLLDFGIGPGLVRFFTEYDRGANARGVQDILSLAFSFYFLMGLIVGGALVLWAPWLIGRLTISPSMRRTAEISIFIVFGYFILSCLVGVLTARLVSLHRMDVTSFIRVIGQVVYAGLVVGVLPRFPTVETAILLNVAQVAITGVLSLIVLSRIGPIRLSNPFSIPPPLIRKVMAFGGWMQINSLASLVTLETDRIIVAAFISIQAVTPYQIGNRLGSLGGVLPTQLLGAAMPNATMLSLNDDPQALKSFYGDMTRYLMLLTVPVVGGIAAVANPFIVAWMGRVFPNAAFVAIGLSLAFGINNLTGMGTTMLRAAGLPKYEAYCGIIGTVLNIVITVALAPKFGLRGIVVGTILAEIFTSICFLVLFHRRYPFGWWETVGTWLWRLFVATFLSVGAVEALRHFIWTPMNRLEAVLQIGLYGAIFSILCVIALTALRFWTREDRDFAVKILRRLRPIRNAA
jgi:O-antigen/teichoic acid export membrane protein